MRLIITSLLVICFAFTMNAQRLVLPSTDVSINGGVTLLKFMDAAAGDFDQEAMPWTANFNITSNQPYGRHIFEVSYSSGETEPIVGVLDAGLDTKFQLASVNYAYMHEIFSYYPSCQIANMVTGGIRLNAELYDFDHTASSLLGTSYGASDLYMYSVDLSIGTDYNFDKRNYITFQFYTPLFSYITRPHDAIFTDEPFESRDFDDSALFQDGESGSFNQLVKIGGVVTYRIMPSDGFGFLLKYHFKSTDFKLDPTFNATAHELTLGLLFHGEHGMKY